MTEKVLHAASIGANHPGKHLATEEGGFAQFLFQDDLHQDAACQVLLGSGVDDPEGRPFEDQRFDFTERDVPLGARIVQAPIGVFLDHSWVFHGFVLNMVQHNRGIIP